MVRVYVVLALVGALLMPVDAAAKAPAHHHHRTAKRCAVHKHRHKRRCVRRKPASKRAATKPAAKPAPLPSSTPATPSPVALPPVLPTATPGPVMPPTTPAARVQATTREFSVTLSRPTIAAGRAIVEFVDAGEDPHDIHIRPAGGGADVLAFPTAQPGDRSDLSVTLAAGSYTLYCSLPSHEGLGMKATLVVQ
jgi:plastocyanin